MTHQHINEPACCAVTGIEGYQPPTPEGWTRSVVPFVGTGTEDDPRRPEVPVGVELWTLVADLGDEAVIDQRPA